MLETHVRQEQRQRDGRRPTAADFACQICSDKSLDIIEAYATLPRVTSDCNPWPAGGTLAVCANCGAVQKLPDATWFSEIKQIYDRYRIYRLSDGAEQVIFDAGGCATPRSRVLVDFVLEHAKLAENGRLIDIGCGNGAALANFSVALPAWSLFANELSDAALPLLRRLPNFVSLYTVSPAQIRNRFDLITMIHSLEHMADPAQALRDVANLLNAGGTVFVEVPNAETSPFDLIVADHLMHFSPRHLAELARRAGLAVATLRDDVLPKEVTLLAQPGRAVPQSVDRGDAALRVTTTIAWLRRLIEQAEALARQGGSIGILGTSISGMWLYGAVRRAASFFVDEDDTRVGRQYDGRPIMAPADVPTGATVLVPLVPKIARSVIARLGTHVRWIAPPDIEA